MKILFSLDEGVQAYWKHRVLVGPEVGDDASIIPPQISILPADGVFTPGATGSTTEEIGIIINLYEQIRSEPFKDGELSGTCRRRHLKKLLATGMAVDANGRYSIDPDANGKLIDPYKWDSVDNSEKFLNVGLIAFRDLPRSLAVKKNGDLYALRFPLLATFEARFDNTTLDRV